MVDAARSTSGYQFPKDTIASILTSGLLGEVYIGLDAGGDTKMLADGGRIAKTQSAVVLEKLIGQFLFDKAASGGAQMKRMRSRRALAAIGARGAARRLRDDRRPRRRSIRSSR